MKRFLLAGATLLALATAQPTLAADAPVYRKGPAPAAAAFDWTGLYIGVQGGYAWGNSAQADLSAVVSPRYSITGGVFGGTLGYNWQMGGIVLGAETDLSWAGITGQTPSGGGFGCSTFPPGCQTEVPWFGTLRLRAGPTWGQILPYVTGGLAYARLNGTIGTAGSGTTTKTSWTAGAGVEVAISRNLSAKVEYLWISNLGTVSLPPSGCVGGPCFVSDAQFSVVRAGVNVRF